MQGVEGLRAGVWAVEETPEVLFADNARPRDETEECGAARMT